MRTDWSAVGDQAGTGMWYAVAIALPLLFLALLAFFALRALARQRRLRVSLGGCHRHESCFGSSWSHVGSPSSRMHTRRAGPD